MLSFYLDSWNKNKKKKKKKEKLPHNLGGFAGWYNVSYRPEMAILLGYSKVSLRFSVYTIHGSF